MVIGKGTKIGIPYFVAILFNAEYLFGLLYEILQQVKANEVVQRAKQVNCILITEKICCFHRCKKHKIFIPAV